MTSTAQQELRLPELGEGISGGQVVAILVTPGQEVDEEETLIEIETDKATMEVPAPFAARIEKVVVEIGQQVQVGDLLCMATPRSSLAKTGEERTPAPAQTAPVEPPQAAPSPSSPQPTASQDAPDGRVPVFASPSVRKFARELGIDLSEVNGTGPGGRISNDDVKRTSRERMTQPGGAAPITPALPESARSPESEIVSMSNIRRATAKQMAKCWTIPHVTLHRTANITEIDHMVRRYRARAEQLGAKVTITSVMLKVLAAALKAYPEINASVDMAREEVVYHKGIHLGVAVDTPKGLLVPVVRDVDKKNIVQIAREVQELAERARAGKLKPHEMRSATFSLTNLGGLGIEYFTPIVNLPEVAILGLGRASQKPLWDGEGFKPELMLPLSLSFDHRLVDGANGARFLSWIADALASPLLLALEG